MKTPRYLSKIGVKGGAKEVQGGRKGIPHEANGGRHVSPPARKKKSVGA